MHILSVIYNGINRPQSNCCRATTVLVTRFHSYDRQHSSRLPLNRFDSRLPRLASNVVHQLLAQRQAELLLLRWLIKLANVILQVAPTKRTHALQHRNQEFSLMNETKTFRRGFSNGFNLKFIPNFHSTRYRPRINQISIYGISVPCDTFICRRSTIENVRIFLRPRGQKQRILVVRYDN